MSTQIKDSVFPDRDMHTIEVLNSTPDLVFFIAQDRQGDSTAAIKRADFLAAVEAELGVIILDPAENPLVIEVEEDYSGSHMLIGGETFSKSLDPAMARWQALRWATAARWIEAQPKIDPAQVKALASVLIDVDGQHVNDIIDFNALAEALLRSGKVGVKNND